MAIPQEVPLQPVIQKVVDTVLDKNRMSAGIKACQGRESDFPGQTAMLLAGIAMIPEARQLMSDEITREWTARQFTTTADYSSQEIIFGGGFHAAVYAANRVRMGFPRPVVLEHNSAERTGGAFAMSLNPVFRLNSRSRPGALGLPDQDKALNDLPGGLLQPSMISSEEYPTNADMAWLIRLTLAQYAEVYPNVTVTGLGSGSSLGISRDETPVKLTLGDGRTIIAGRVIDATGTGTEITDNPGGSDRILTFSQFMARMGTMFPLRSIRQAAVIGGGNAGLCAAESLLGIAPGHTSAIGLDYVDRVDLYATTVDGRTCEQFRQASRGRYIRTAQFLDGNVSNPSTRLQIINQLGYPTAIPDGVIVNDRTYNLAIVCTGSQLASLRPAGLSYFSVRRPGQNGAGTVIATRAQPYGAYRIGPAANLVFSDAEIASGITAIAANKISIFRNAPKTAALAFLLGGLK